MMIRGFYKKYSEHEIVEGIENKNEAIITYLIKILKPYVFSWIKKRGGSKEDAEDNFYNTWEKVLENIKMEKYKAKNFEGYFKKISQNKWKKDIRDNHIESGTVSLEYDIPDKAEEELMEELMNEKLFGKVYEKLNELSEECREILIMKYYNNTSSKEIAKRMKLSEKFVRVRLYRCKKYLLKLLKGEPDFIIEQDGRRR